jgi:hypothetical protein
VIEIVDSEEKVNAFLPVLDQIMGGGLVTLERTMVIRYQDQEKRYRSSSNLPLRLSLASNASDET